MILNNIINIHIEKAYRNLVNQTRLKLAADTLLDYFHKNNVEITVSIIGEKKIRELNRNYRSINSETDVLSFASDEINPETNKKIIGDVIISYPVAEKQSRAVNNQIGDELELLTIHGVLHLLGYDHETKEGEKIMFAFQSHLVQCIADPLKKNHN